MTKSPPESSPPESLSSQTGLQLVLMRHAKSDWADEDLSDHDRPLNKRGLRDAPRMARWIAESGLLPTHILCSSATRTQQTAMLMQSYWDNTKLETAHLHVIPELYLAPGDAILEIVCNDFANSIENSGNQPRTVLVLAHNPGISYAASALLEHAIGLSTAAMVAFRCDVPRWSVPLTAENTRYLAEMKPKGLDRDARPQT